MRQGAGPAAAPRLCRARKARALCCGRKERQDAGRSRPSRNAILRPVWRRDGRAGAAPRLVRPLPELPGGAHVPRLPQGRRSMPGLRRGIAPSARRRFSGLCGDRDGRPHRGAAGAGGGDDLRAAVLGAHGAVAGRGVRSRARAVAAGQGRHRRAAMGARHARLRGGQDRARDGLVGKFIAGATPFVPAEAGTQAFSPSNPGLPLSRE